MKSKPRWMKSVIAAAEDESNVPAAPRLRAARLTIAPKPPEPAKV